MKSGFSIVVCCYNSSSRIEETLRFLFNLKTTGEIGCEILLINNNSNDDTVDKANRAGKLLNFHKLTFRIIDEPRPGLAFARKCGVDAACYDNIIFCDDDNHFSEDYLIVAANLLKQHPQAGILGGWAKPKFEVKEWLVDFFPAMAVGKQATSDGFVNWVYGAGMILRKEIFKTLEKRGMKFLLTDRKGDTLTSGGDAEICGLALFLGYKIYYSSNLVLFHAIPEHRLTKSHYLKAKFSTIFPSIYLFILDYKIRNEKRTGTELYSFKIISTIKNLVYLTPRAVLGRHRFYSFFMMYRTWQTLVWLLVHKKRFNEIYQETSKNLSGN